jgi:amino acid transporter
MVGIFVLFEVVQVAIQMGLTQEQIVNASSNLLPIVGEMIFGKPWGDIAILAVLISTVATLETSLLQASRTLYSMGRDRVIGRKFAELHPRFQTPWVASVAIGIVALLLFVLSSFSSGINELMTAAINAIGLQIAFYYGLTGFACAWYYRATLFTSFRNLFMRGIWPVAAGVFLWIVAIYDIPQLGLTTDLVGLGTLVIGLVPLVYYRKRYRSPFYQAARDRWSPEQFVPSGEATAYQD